MCPQSVNTNPEAYQSRVTIMSTGCKPVNMSTALYLCQQSTSIHKYFDYVILTCQHHTQDMPTETYPIWFIND